MMHEFNSEKVTIIYQGELGLAYNAVHARLHEHGTRQWAQYSSVVQVTFTPKRKRNKRRIIKHYRPNVVILRGWIQVDIPDMWCAATRRTTGVVSRTARDVSFGPTWDHDANAAIEAAVDSGAEILADYRGHDTTMSAAERE